MNRQCPTLRTIAEIEAKADSQDQLNNLVTLLVYLLNSVDPDLDPRTEHERQRDFRPSPWHWTRAYKHLFHTVRVADINFALGTRNRVVHPESYSQPASKDNVDKSVRYLLEAIVNDVLPVVALKEPDLAKAVLTKTRTTSLARQQLAIEADELPHPTVTVDTPSSFRPTPSSLPPAGISQSHGSTEIVAASYERPSWPTQAVMMLNVIGAVALLALGFVVLLRTPGDPVPPDTTRSGPTRQQHSGTGTATADKVDFAAPNPTNERLTAQESHALPPHVHPEQHVTDAVPREYAPQVATHQPAQPAKDLDAALTTPASSWQSLDGSIRTRLAEAIDNRTLSDISMISELIPRAREEVCVIIKDALRIPDDRNIWIQFDEQAEHVVIRVHYQTSTADYLAVQFSVPVKANALKAADLRNEDYLVQTDVLKQTGSTLVLDENTVGEISKTGFVTSKPISFEDQAHQPRFPVDLTLGKYHFERAKQLYSEGHYKEAQIAASVAYEYDPTNSAAYSLTVRSQQALSGFLEPLPLQSGHDSHYHVGNNNARLFALHNEALDCLHAGDFDEAKHLLQTAIQLSPTFLEGYRALGTLYSQQGLHAEAIAQYDRAIEINPLDSLSYYNRAVAYKDLRQYTHALADVERAIRIQATDPGYHHLRGLVLFHLERHSTAIDAFTKAMDLDPSLERAFYWRAQSYLRIGSFRSALDDLNAAILLNADYAKSYFDRGNAWFRLDQFDNAISDYTTAINRGITDKARAYYNRSVAWERKGNESNMQADRAKARQLGLNP